MVKLAPLEIHFASANFQTPKNFFLPVFVSLRRKDFVILTSPDNFGLREAISFAQERRRLPFLNTNICFHHVKNDWRTVHLQIDFFRNDSREVDIDLTFVFARIGCSEVLDLNLIRENLVA
jgi:hypothetical protein